MNYFTANYVIKRSRSYPGMFSYAADILMSQAGDPELARVAIQAVGLAGLAGSRGAESLICKARAMPRPSIGSTWPWRI